MDAITWKNSNQGKSQAIRSPPQTTDQAGCRPVAASTDAHADSAISVPDTPVAGWRRRDAQPRTVAPAGLDGEAQLGERRVGDQHAPRAVEPDRSAGPR